MAVIVIFLEILLHAEDVLSIAVPYRVPVLVLALLIVVALFDSALDLEAEWTIAMLTSAKDVQNPSGEITLARAIWQTNQFRDKQLAVFTSAKDGTASTLSFGSFTATAQNLIIFAAAIVTVILVAIVVTLWRQAVCSVPINL
ncbi:MAG: hypothetical protein JO071_09075 [Deltaproteobacteria bacterium]|nr:hypothetical protein [Deltaproteobacteria bacterium]